MLDVHGTSIIFLVHNARERWVPMSYGNLYTPVQQKILQKLDDIYDDEFHQLNVKKLPVTPTQLIDAFPAWPKVSTQTVLKLSEFDIRFVYTRDDDDDSPEYIFVTPDESLLWPNKNPMCPDCGEIRRSELTKDGYAKPIGIQDIPTSRKRRIVVFLHRRYVCRTCGTSFRVPLDCFFTKGGDLSSRLCNAIGNAALEKQSYESVAYTYAVDGKTVKKYMRAELERRKTTCKLATPKHIGIDEAKIRLSDGPKVYVVILNTDEDAENNGVIEITDVLRNKNAISSVFDRFENPEAVETITMDMCAAYREAARLSLPQARIIVDRFHLVQSLTDKVKQVSKALYARNKQLLDEELGCESVPDGLDTNLADSECIDEAINQHLQEDLEIEYDESILISKTSSARRHSARQKREILKNDYRYIWFAMNPQKISKYSLIRFSNLLATFPDFMNLYQIKEKLRYNFFMAKDADEARDIAAAAESMLPKGDPIYAPLRTYFTTLNHSDWTPHIYAYFDDPIDDPTVPLPDGTIPKKRFSNAKVENFNMMAKEMNAASRGLMWDDFCGKVLYGNLKVKSRPKRYTRAENSMALMLSTLDKAISYMDGFTSHRPAPNIPAPSYIEWESIFSVPAVQLKLMQWGFHSMKSIELVGLLQQNDNIRGALLGLLRGKETILSSLPPSDTGDDPEETIEVVQPLRFSDWAKNKDEYLRIINADTEFLFNLEYME